MFAHRLMALMTASHHQRPVAAFLRGALLGYGIQLVGLGLGFIVSVLVARVLGPDGRGTFAWMMTLHGMVLPFAMVGLDTFIRQRGADANRAVQGALLGTGAVLVAAMAVLVGLVLYGVGWQTEIGGGNPRLMAIAVAFAPVAAAANVFALLLMAQRRMVLSNVMSLLPRLVSALALIGLLVAGAVSVRWVLIASLAGAPLMLMALWVMFAREGIRPRVEWGVLLTHKKFVGGAYLATLLTYLLQRQDILMLGAYAGAGEVGHYSVAGTFIDVLLIAPMVTGVFLLPHLQSQQPGPGRRAFARKVLLATGAALLMVALAGIAVAHPLVVTLYGAEFEAAVPLLRILLVAFVMFGMLGLLQNVLALAAKGPPLIVAPAVGAVLNLLLNLWWLPAYGATGAAWSSVVSYGVACVAAWVMCKRYRAE